MKRGAPRVVAGLLERAAERGDAAPSAHAQAAAFRGRAVPGIPVRRYAERIYRYAGCSPACFVAAYVYLDRLLGQDAGDAREEEAAAAPAAAAAAVVVDSYTVHRLLITAVMVAAKFMDDRHHNNAYFARVGGVEVAEMNALELRLLFALRFRLNVAPATFARYCAALEAEMLLHGHAEGCSPCLPLQTQNDDEEEEAAVVVDERRRDRRQALLMARAPQDDATAAVLVVADTRRLASALVEIAQ
ncbi:hypothetical protein U9M48_025844 [Paspalum notatum var. saurae]|uniref:Cyclin n=1 Tax=Paspalum notatum var. saurae TaxID=547442 RepID=A0AAQ3TRL0_PASNO